jgi:NADPH:quinone reductase-like Zn-dependent oxidoreductase
MLAGRSIRTRRSEGRGMMQAIVIREHGGPEVLRPADLPIPEPARGEALVRVRAVSVGGFLDISNRKGQVAFARYSFPHVLGSEHAGEIAAFGPGADTALAVGDQVAVSNRITCGICASCRAGREEACLQLGVIGVTMPGAYAEYSVVPVGNLRRLPAGISHVEASAMIVNGPLAQHQLDLAGASQGHWVLIQATASASGSMAMRSAQHRGCRVIATSRQAWKRERLAELGADVVLDPALDDFATAVKKATGADGADVAIINIGDAHLWEQTIQSVANRGRIVSSGANFGGRAAFNARTFYERNQTIIGVRTANSESTERCWAEIERGLRPVVDEIYPLPEVAEAHRRVEAGMNVGRVVLTVD